MNFSSFATHSPYFPRMKKIGIASEQQGPKVEIEGVWNLIFDIVAILVAVSLIGSTIFILYKKEYVSKANNKDSDESDDTVYVTAPDGNETSSALA